MKKQLVTVGLSSLLALSACGTNEEASNEENEGSTQKAQASSDDSSSNNEGETSEADSEETSDRYEKLHKTMTTFSLPEEGRVSKEEAEAGFTEFLRPEDDFEDVILYKNSMVFDKETQETYRYTWTNYGKATEGFKTEPEGTQALGALKYIVNEQLTRYPTPSGKVGVPLSEIENYEENVDYSKEAESEERLTGYEAIEEGSHSSLHELYRIEPYVEQFDAVHDWTTETIHYFEEARSYDEDEWKQAYKYYKKGVDNIDEMERAINE
ncbi:hypothetical protein CHL76_02145 [Marinococcus halophilus]|uniref:Lipoprotein n=1 Tax=Marinococcus halophilus TaxID=1371 RepID=A0A510Y1C1_MARHA|nr:hypothetical protein [Marinococcus halophilus]OZT81178.1 hypothetical protein CHL76_02145 [Marinococcus halophilus]GEK57108.1 hypothetical protein MHA01_00130 [Marinococcus halophilus]